MATGVYTDILPQLQGEALKLEMRQKKTQNKHIKNKDIKLSREKISHISSFKMSALFAFIIKHVIRTSFMLHNVILNTGIP